MSKTINAVYANGVFRPEAPFDLPEGVTVRITVHPDLPESLPDGRRAHEILAAIAARSVRRGEPENTSERVDEILYGVKGDAGNVR